MSGELLRTSTPISLLGTSTHPKTQQSSMYEIAVSFSLTVGDPLCTVQRVVQGLGLEMSQTRVGTQREHALDLRFTPVLERQPDTVRNG